MKIMKEYREILYEIQRKKEELRTMNGKGVVMKIMTE